jgi:phosphomannomutase
MIYIPPMAIRFGTSGWRAVISEEFTFPNVRRLAHAIAGHIKEHTEYGYAGSEYRQHLGPHPDPGVPVVVIGRDTRMFSEDFSREIAEVLAASGVRTLLASADAPTPAVAWSVLEARALGGVVLTASHGPAQLSGVKWLPFWGGPATPEVTEDIERRLALVTHQTIRSMAYDKAVRDGWIVVKDLRPGYERQLRKLVDLKRLKTARLKVAVDSMHGAVRGYLRPILEESGLETPGLREERDVLFGGRPPEPTPENLSELAGLMRKKRLDLGLACDGDGDRFGILDAGGEWVPANDVLGLALHHLVAHKGMKGGVARNLMTSHFVDAVAKQHGLRVRETPVGFRHVGDLLRSGDFILGGEESAGLSIGGHVPERDGILACLLMAELVACEGKPLAKIREALFKKVGAFHNTRVDFHLESTSDAKDLADRLALKPPLELAGGSVWRIDQTDGFKFILKDGRWLGLRLSGTEPVARLYAEASDAKGLQALIDDGKRIIRGGRK